MKKVESMTKLIRHEIDPALVEQEVNKKNDELNRMREQSKIDHKNTRAAYAQDMKTPNPRRTWKQAPGKRDKSDENYDELVNYEKKHHALVRVIEDTEKQGDRFYLVYGKNKDEAKGTGPFISLEKAQAWFLNGGR